VKPGGGGGSVAVFRSTSIKLDRSAGDRGGQGLFLERVGGTAERWVHAQGEGKCAIFLFTQKFFFTR
jgi:hypothetical protein